jgi:enoyl-CoA hydratase/carnithine racemase
MPKAPQSLVWLLALYPIGSYYEPLLRLAQQLAVKPRAALQSCKRLMRSSTRDLLERAVKLENQEFAVRVRSAEAKEAFTAFIEKRKPNFDTVSEPKARAA